MKTHKVKSLKLVKASIANLDASKQERIVGGGTRAWTGCLTFNSMCPTSCHAH
ncbi:hypothetical protein [Kordia sp.]|uniref:hypothetical protein n=1 Tax=Kordia sp. TaxID=1965332 RepID=UPI0025B8F786|nr:hypothetical protein [Kordia sp.]MCH2193361.1 hypothetical protein [Kordia sp.]